MTYGRDPSAALALILDTDIGSDVDDELALAVLLGSPEVDLRLVTTAYGDTALRARIAKRISTLAGHTVPCVPGAQTPLSDREIWWAGHEGKNFMNLASERVDDTETATSALASAVVHDRATAVLAIAPLTNIAHALSSDAGFSTVEHIVVMGGDWTGDSEAEHNLRSDPEAAHLVFGSAARITAIGLDQTKRVVLDRTDIEAIGEWADLGALLRIELLQWLDFWNDDTDHPHDAVAALTLTSPELFSYTNRGIVTVDRRSGVATFSEDADGNVRLIDDMDIAGVKHAILRRMKTACLRWAAIKASDLHA